MSFAKESDVRAIALLDDFESVPSKQILDSLQSAHNEILRDTTLTNESETTSSIIRAESLLALSYLLNAWSLSSAISNKNIHFSKMQVDAKSHAEQLWSMSNLLREEAWALLRDYVITAPPSPLHLIQGGE